MSFSQRTSIHGRRLGLTSTGGIHGAAINSTLVADNVAQMWGDGFQETSTGGSTLTNYGYSYISTAVTANTGFELAAPVAGVWKEIYSLSSAAALMTISAGSSTVTFVSSGGVIAGTTSIVIGSTTAGSCGYNVLLRGHSATRWLVIDRTSS